MESDRFAGSLQSGPPYDIPIPQSGRGIHYHYPNASGLRYGSLTFGSGFQKKQVSQRSGLNRLQLSGRLDAWTCGHSRFSDNQFGVYGDFYRIGAAVDSLQQDFACQGPHFVQGLPNCSQAGNLERRAIDVVEADHGDIFWNTQAGVT